MQKIKAWLYAFRLRTLPLAFSSIITGSSIAYADKTGYFDWTVFTLCLGTTLFLQVLSNLANDYGDSQKGADNHERIGPPRAVQAGMLTVTEIKTGIFICTLLCLISGMALINKSLGSHSVYALAFLLLGFAAIAAAIKYTVGKGAYGYKGFGDLFVLLFFGIVGVCGSYYLLAHRVHYTVLLPAFSIGALATAVLNLNNMRDELTDAKAGKITVVVKMGLANAKKYHTALVISALVAAALYAVLNWTDSTSTMQLLFIVTIPLFRRHLVAVHRITERKEFDPLLKELALSTFIFSILFAAGIIIGSAY